jgi:heterodisulfide reductase subunit C
MKDNVILEKSMRLDFLGEIYSIPGGEKIKDCIQCGTCSGSCPTSDLMDYTPRQIFAMIRAGMRDEVLTANTSWLCTSCYSCYVRCPQDIKITDIMYALKRLAIKEGKFPKGGDAQEFSKAFAKVVNRYGRNHEMELMQRYFLKTKPLDLLRNMPVGLKMLRHGRLPLLPKKMRNISQLQKIIRKAKSLGGS